MRGFNIYSAFNFTVEVNCIASIAFEAAFPISYPMRLTKVMLEETYAPDEGILHHAEGIDLMPGNIALSVTQAPIEDVLLFGLSPDNKPYSSGILKPVLTLKTRIVHINELPAGTTIGYGRAF